MVSHWRTVQTALTLVLAAAALAVPTRLTAQVFTDPQFSSDVVATLPQYSPVGIDWSPDGRMFILQKHGVVRIVKDGVLLPTPFVNISSHVNIARDSGLLGIAFHPDFANNGYFYLAYVFEEGGNPNDAGPKTSRVVRMRADPANPDVALPGSETVILGGCQNPGSGADCLYVNMNVHTVGTLRFAPDGKLIVGHGDGGLVWVADENLRAQNLDSLNGKILRVNDDGTAPSDNPFYDGNPNSNRSKVWAYGLRNPYRFVLHPVTGIPYVGDVGWEHFEELDIAIRGGNLGWPCYEGLSREPEHTEAFPQCAALQPTAVVAPFFTYGRSVGASVTAGDFYRGTAYPELYRGNLFFADYVAGFIRRVVFDANGNPATFPVFATGVPRPVDLKQGPDGLLYYIAFDSGQIRRIRFNGPTAVASATPMNGYSPLTVAFSSAGSTAPSGGTLTYLWNFGDGSTATGANPVHVYTASSVTNYTATLTVSSGGMTSTARVRITVGSLPPDPVILAPADGTTFMPGELVSYQGSASDPDDGTLSGTALTWTVLLHHNTHIHTFVGSTGATGSFLTEYHGVGDYAYELVLTATDSSGLSRTVRRLLPLTPDTTPPTTPGSLTATIVGSDIRLTWAASTDNYGVDGYRLERCQGVACSTFALIASPTAITYTDTGLALDASYSYRVRAVDAAGLSSAYSNVASATTPRATISVVRSTPTGTVNLSATANDWVHWGLSTSTTVTRKAGVAPSIGAVAIVGAVPATRYTSHPVAFTWTDGAPTTTATTNAAIYVSGVGNGFRLTVPADLIRRRLTLYVGVWRAQGRLVASLSDGSTPDYVDTGLNNAGGATAGRYTIEYQAGTANQTLTVTFTQESGDGNVTLQAATLVSVAAEAPDYLVFAAPSTRVVAPGGATTYNVSVTSTGGFVGGVALTVEGLPAGATATFAPSTIVGGSGTSTVTITVPASVAHGESTLSILGASGSLRRSAFVTLRVNAPTLSGGVAVPTGDQVLSTLGPSDWAHWGITSETSHTHKAGITPLISYYTVVGGGEATRYTNHPIGFSWTGGTPTASATNSTTGVYVAGVNRGFRITVPADTSTRTLILYVGVFQSQGRLVAQLSDQSAPDYIDTSLLNATTATAGRYTLSYRAASPGQTLTVTFTQMGTTGNVTLQAAALSATASDFILTATPATRTIGPGAQTTYAVSVAPVDGFTGNVALSVSGLPAGATATFAPATVTGGSGSSTLTITTSATTPSASSALTVTGTSGTLTHTTPISLVGLHTRYFAEGSTGFFDTSLAVLNFSTTATAHIALTLLNEAGGVVSHELTLGPSQRRNVSINAVLGVPAAVAMVVESDVPVAADRFMTWGPTGIGASLDSGVPTPATTWYFAEGATGPFLLYYLFENPSTTAATVTVRYLIEGGPPVTTTHTLPPRSRTTIPVNQDDPALAVASVGSVITSDVPIFAERAMYLNAGGTLGGGSASAGSNQLATQWYFGEGATGPFFHCFLSLLNPGTTAATATVTYHLSDGSTASKAYQVPAESRRTVYFNGEAASDPALAALATGPVWFTVTSTQPILGERAMWWSDWPWHEGHAAPGNTTSAVSWAVPDGSHGGSTLEATYVLIGNTTMTPGQVRLTLIPDTGASSTRALPIGAGERLTVNIGSLFGLTEGRFSVIVDSLGSPATPLAVDYARYRSVNGVPFSGGGAAPAIPLPAERDR